MTFDIWQNLFNKDVINQTFNLDLEKLYLLKTFRANTYHFPDCKIKYVKGTPGDQFSVCSNNNLLKNLNLKTLFLNSGLKNLLKVLIKKIIDNNEFYYKKTKKKF